MEETGVTGENHRPAASQWQTLLNDKEFCFSWLYLRVSSPRVCLRGSIRGFNVVQPETIFQFQSVNQIARFSEHSWLYLLLHVNKHGRRTVRHSWRGRTLSFSCKWKRKPLPKSVQSNEQCLKYYLQFSTSYGSTNHHKLWKYYHRLQYQKLKIPLKASKNLQ